MGQASHQLIKFTDDIGNFLQIFPQYICPEVLLITEIVLDAVGTKESKITGNLQRSPS